MGTQKKAVFVVDDDVPLLEALRLALEPAGFDVFAASNPFAAVRLAATYPPDAIVLDLDMPGMDGAEAARHLRRIEQTRHIPILAFTGQALESIEAPERAGFDWIVAKTDGLDALEHAIREVLAAPASPA